MRYESIVWPNREPVAVSIVANVEEGSELSIARGDPGMEPVDELGIHLKRAIRNYGNETNYLYGIKAGAPRVLGLLAEHGIKATWTVAAMSLEAHPELALAIRDQGHETCSHGWRWVHQFRMAEDEERAFIARATASIEASVGVRPFGWLSRYLLTDNTRRLLIEAGYEYHMDDYSSDVPFIDASTVPGRLITIVPYALDTNDMKMWTDPSLTPTDWLKYACDSFDQLHREGERGAAKMMSLGLHLRIIGRPGRIWALAAFLEHVRGRGAWIATRREIAAHARAVLA